ncbi:MAG: hypothetical protein ACM3YO_04730, partial [Bacteroidota bacterium]
MQKTTLFTPPKELTAAFVQETYDQLTRALKQLGEAKDWIDFFHQWNSFKAYLSGENARRSLKENQNTEDAAAEKAAAFMRETIAPLQEERDAAIREALLASPHRDALEKEFGELLFVNFEVAQSAFVPENIALNTEISNLTARYSKIVGGAKVTVDGEELTMPRALALWEHPEEGKRKAAWEAINEWTTAHSDELHSIYSSMVELRHQCALNLGEKNFVPVGYKRMRRTDYGPEQVAQFREEIKRYVVPLLQRFQEKQAELLGQKTVKP